MHRMMTVASAHERECLHMTALASLRALVLDDDPVYRRIVSTSLQRIGISQISVAGELGIAEQKLQAESFDVVTIDVVLRDGSGLDVLTWIKANRPNIITILVTAGSNSEACREVDALLLGASALVLKPSGAGAADKLDKSFKDIIDSILRDRVTPHVQSSRGTTPSTTPAQRTNTAPLRDPALLAAPRELIAIGASTGGPPVVMQFLDSLPKDYHTPIVITQHMPALHIPHFAKLLRDRSGRMVEVAKDGETVQPNRVYVAPGALHLTVQRHGTQLLLKHDNGPEEHNCKPAVDPMFRSVAEACGNKAIGVVMTGMGSDGALGAVALRNKGTPVVVQDKPSSVVWGMPGATVQKGAASLIVPAASLADSVIKLDSSISSMASVAGAAR
jgi:two-component system, chemotaxis family, protein-glutamate methylesterase/glutaminase